MGSGENGANGMSDMAGYAARVAVERSGSCRDTMEPRGASDIDGQTERSIWAGAHESKRGKRTSFKWPGAHESIQ